MSPEVVNIKAYHRTKLKVEFADGSIRLSDMEPLLHYPAFSELRNSTLFMKAHVENGTVSCNEEIDISPDTLYLCGEALNRDEAVKAKSAA